MARNSARMGIDLTGFGEMRKLLTDLPPAMESRVMGDAMNLAMRPIVNAIKARVKVRSGALRRSITSTVKRYPKAGKVIGFVGPDTQYYGAGKRLKKGASRKGSDRPSKYAYLVEFGHYAGAQSGRKGGFVKGTSIKAGTATPTVFIRPQSFMRSGVAAGTPAAIQSLAAATEKGMERELKRLTRKRARLASTATL